MQSIDHFSVSLLFSCTWYNRDTLAEHVPCLYFLRQPPRKVSMSRAQSECSFRDSMVSRQSSASKTKFHRVSSTSTADTVSVGFVLFCFFL